MYIDEGTNKPFKNQKSSNDLANVRVEALSSHD
jgi:hypothetical protein